VKRYARHFAADVLRCAAGVTAVAGLTFFLQAVFRMLPRLAGEAAPVDLLVRAWHQIAALAYAAWPLLSCLGFALALFSWTRSRQHEMLAAVGLPLARVVVAGFLASLLTLAAGHLAFGAALRERPLVASASWQGALGWHALVRHPGGAHVLATVRTSSGGPVVELTRVQSLEDIEPEVALASALFEEDGRALAARALWLSIVLVQLVAASRAGARSSLALALGWPVLAWGVWFGARRVGLELAGPHASPLPAELAALLPIALAGTGLARAHLRPDGVRVF